MSKNNKGPWNICAEGKCVFTAHTSPSSGRCIRHGALIDFIGHRFTDMTREQVRVAIKSR